VTFFVIDNGGKINECSCNCMSLRQVTESLHEDRGLILWVFYIHFLVPGTSKKVAVVERM